MLFRLQVKLSKMWYCEFDGCEHMLCFTMHQNFNKHSVVLIWLQWHKKQYRTYLVIDFPMLICPLQWFTYPQATHWKIRSYRLKSTDTVPLYTSILHQIFTWSISSVTSSATWDQYSSSELPIDDSNVAGEFPEELPCWLGWLRPGVTAFRLGATPAWEVL